MNVTIFFGKLVYLEIKKGSVILLISLSKPAKPKDDVQNKTPRQIWVRMPIAKFPSELGLQNGDEVEVFGNVNSTVIRNQVTGEEELYPEIVAHSINRATQVGDIPKDEQKLFSIVILSVCIKYIVPISPEDEGDGRKPLMVYAQISAERERPSADTPVDFRRSDTLAIPFFRGAKDHLLKEMQRQSMIGKGLIINGSLSGRITNRKKKILLDELDEEGQPKIEFIQKEFFHPVITALTAQITPVLSERMFNPVNQANGHEESGTVE